MKGLKRRLNLLVATIGTVALQLSVAGRADAQGPTCTSFPVFANGNVTNINPRMDDKGYFGSFHGNGSAQINVYFFNSSGQWVDGYQQQFSSASFDLNISPPGVSWSTFRLDFSTSAGTPGNYSNAGGTYGGC